VVRSARLIDAARPRSWRTFGPRRLRRHQMPTRSPPKVTNAGHARLLDAWKVAFGHLA